KVGVVLATSGPGATNLVTGLATAHMDSIPLVAITGQVRSTLIGNDAFQEADTTGVTRPVTKYNALVKRAEDLGRVLKEAFHIARTGRPGPVVVDIAVDATVNTVQEEPELEPRLPGYRPRLSGHNRQIKMAAEAINEAQKPVLYVGGGVIISGAAEELTALARKGKIPVTTTLMGMGAFDESDTLSLKMLGMHGTAYANFAVQNCDCIVSVGARFDDRVTGKLETFAPNAKIVHIDIDPASISKTVEVDVPVVGDAKDILAKMLEYIETKDRPEWHEQIARWKKDYPLAYSKESKDGRCKPQEVVRLLGEMTNHEAIIATGVGQHQMWAAQYYDWRFPRQCITSGGLGTMGYGVPSAIGAKLGCPDKTVIDIDGDGSFIMTMQEIVTAAIYKVAAKFVVLDNNFLGMVRQWQDLFYDKRYSSVQHPCPDFAAVADAFGAKGIRVSKPDELEKGIRELLDYNDGPAVLVVEVEEEENVFPMVASGKSLHEMDMGTLA
ncbi:MAG: biosynthetic-type acetolactate synthase large subunit, partial [Phycisphaerae bacterium]